MNRIKYLKIVQLILIAVMGLLGYIFLFQRTSPATMYQDMIPIANLYFLLLTGLGVMLIFLFLDLHFMTKLQVEKQGIDRLTYLDPVTGGLNRASADMLSKQYESGEVMPSVGCFVFRITNLVDINKAFGYKEGDRMLRSFYSLLEMATKNEGIITRNNPDRFIVLLKNTDRGAAAEFLDKINKAVSNYNVDEFDHPIEYTKDFALNSEEKKETVSELISVAFSRLN